MSGSAPNWTQGYAPTAGQWQSAFSGKQDWTQTLQDISNGAVNYIVQLVSISGTPNAIVATPNTSLSAIADNTIFSITPTATNTGNTTIQIQLQIGTVTLDVYNGGALCVGGECVAGVPMMVQYDGTNLNTLTAFQVGTYNIKQFGAKGDGVTNDTAAFKAASAVLTANGGHLVVPPGNYIVDYQTFAGTTGLGYAYAGQYIIQIIGASKSITIDGYGAILTIASGLKYGSYDPTTGAPYYPTLPFTNYDYQAYVGGFFNIQNCTAPVLIRGFELNGNLENLALGGQWGDTGYQVAAYGIIAENNKYLRVEDCYIHHNGLDGIYIQRDSVTETSEEWLHTLINIDSEYNGRQGLSWCGGNNLTCIDCQFNETGNSTFASAPSAGVDIEPISGTMCRNGVFINCHFGYNSGVGLISELSNGDTADIEFIKCKFVGTINWALWPNVPRARFLDCVIAGGTTSPYASTEPSEATQFVRCIFSDEIKYGSTLSNISPLLNMNTAQNVLLDRCSIISTRGIAGDIEAAYLRDTTFNCQAGTGYIPDTDACLILTNSTLINVEILDNITVNVPATGYYVSLNGIPSETYIGYNNIVSANSKIKWFTATGAWGYSGNVEGSPLNSHGFYIGGVQRALVSYGTGIPASGTYAAGSYIFNTSPAVGSPWFWICTLGGSPGTWVAGPNL